MTPGAVLKENYVICGDERGIYARPFNTEQATEYLGVSQRSIMRYVQAGILPARKVGNRWLFSQYDLAKLAGVV